MSFSSLSLLRSVVPVAESLWHNSSDVIFAAGAVVHTYLARRLCFGLVKWGSRSFSRLRSTRLACLPLFLASAFFASACLAQSSSFVANTGLSTDGYYVLSWDSGEAESRAQEYQLEESGEENFSDASVIYSGPDRSRVMSGKPDGIYYYRLSLVAPGSPAVGAVVPVEVRHHSIQRASFFFFLGLVVFGSILVTVFIGMREQSKDGH